MAQFVYENFDLRIDATPSGYVAEVLRSPEGEGSHSFNFELAGLNDFLTSTSGYFHDRFRELEIAERSGGSILSGDDLKTFGERLFETVFGGGVRDRLQRSLGRARSEQKCLRLRLRLERVPELARLPWEALFCDNDFLCLSIDTPIVRYLEVEQSIRPLTVSPPLNVLVMTASPSDHDSLDAEREFALLSEALAELRGLVAVRRLRHATWESLQRELRSESFHIFHFVGHGTFDAASHSGVLLFEDERGRGWPVSSEALRRLLGNERTLRLAVLNACKGARHAERDPFLGTAQGLVLAGVPAVIAMQFAVTDRAAVAFAKEFYRALADNYPVEAALTEARIALASQGEGLEWGTPVLFMRSDDGRLLNLEYAGALENLDVLRELPVLPEAAREAVREFRVVFAEARRRINELGDYKALHDQLHQLQFGCYNFVALELRRVTVESDGGLATELQPMLLETSATNLRRITGELARIAARENIRDYETRWLERLEHAEEQLQEAVETRSLGSLKRAAEAIERVLDMEPVKINWELTSTARRLNLASLLDALRRVRDSLEGPEIDPGVATRFAAGVEALARLHDDLERLLKHHYKWQDVDRELSLIRRAGMYQSPGFSEDWQRLRDAVSHLEVQTQPDWIARELHSCAERVDQILVEERYRELDRPLEQYHHSVQMRFNQIDLELKSTCEALRPGGERLDAMLEVIDRG